MHLSNQQPVGLPNYSQSNNLQRSKSVSHLLADYNGYLASNQQQDLMIDRRPAGPPKFLSVSSASTNNLNFVGLMPVGAQQMSQPNQFVKVSSQLDISKPSQYNNNHNKKPIRQIAQHNGVDNNHALESSDGFGTKPSLDDKIRHLLISGDSGLIDGSTRAGDNTEASNVTCHQHSSIAASGSSSQAAWAASIKQQAALSLPTTTNQQLPNGNFAYKNSGEDAVPTASSDNKSSSSQRLQPSQPLLNPNNSYPIGTSTASNQLTNRIYINDSVVDGKMGNRQQRQYQVANNGAIKHQLESPLGQNKISSRNKNDQASRSSQLIVDLTTPRVLAKTQTTLQSAPTSAQTLQQQSAAQTRDSTDVWPASSINRLGLPVHQDAVFAQSRNNNTGTGSTGPRTRTHEISIKSFGSNEANSKVAASFERTAPYYYSDLKSEEQRQALLSIVQQKSLSPPPKLLSRSTDQSSTRLALKSATLHAGQARVLSESLLARQQQRSKNGGQQQVGSGSTGQFSSVCNVAKNIDRLFDSPTQIASREDERMRVQSMLTLNESCCKNDNSNQDSIQTNAESISSGYYSGDLQRNKSLTSKSKSLENLSQNAADSQKLRVPVYENIRRTDKLMSAINKSTNLENSMDSIFGSESLEDEDDDDDHNESDSSLDIIDEIKISSSSNDQLSDISQLIEQLKNNHSKLSDEYRSTLLRISKIINSNDSRTSDGHHLKNEKLAKRLQLLKRKSKRCETRSKNQLALIQMMEKVLKQSKFRAINNASTAANNLAAQSSPDVGSKSTDKGLLRHSPKTDDQPTTGGRLDSGSKSEQLKMYPVKKSPVIKAIVTESDIGEASRRANAGPNLEQKKSNDNQKPAVEVSSSSASSAALEKKGAAGSGYDRDGDEDSGGSTDDSSSISSEAMAQEKPSTDNGTIRDEEDFIEFLSTEGSSHRSQFEASQFSASDFNTSNSESSKESNNNSRPREVVVKKGGSKFNNVLGNVIDVDVCSLNNLSRYSPVNNPASC